MILLGWALWLFTVFIAGFAPLSRLTGFSRTESVSTGFVMGATLLPFSLFLTNAILHIPVLNNQGGFWFTAALIFAMFIWSIHYLTQLWLGTSHRATRVDHAKIIRRQNPLSTIGIIILIASILIFFLQVILALRQPLFGWDEYSFWLYAAKALVLQGGASTAMVHDAYASYPLGFPYLVAWFYHLTGNISIAQAKILTPVVTVATLCSMYQVLIRIGIKPLLAWLSLALTVWGCQIYFMYNALAFGEMIFVDTFALAITYAVAWMNTRASSDFLVFAFLLGLTTFLRVDGDYIAIMTAVLLWITVTWGANKSKIRHTSRRAVVIGMISAVLPTGAWMLFKFSHHVHAGWTSRITISEVMYRLSNPFSSEMIHAMWVTMSNWHIYPILIALALLFLSLAFIRRRDVTFLIVVAVAQIIYLFVAYLTVFSRFEALHASSLDRYLLRVDPLTALALVLSLAPRIHTTPKLETNLFKHEVATRRARHPRG